MSYPTTATVLDNLDNLIKVGTSRNMYSVCDELSIFDWWRERLSVTAMREMRAFLRAARSMGFNGYACFKVGASGCASGMWAYRAESEDGYSPRGEFLYRSFYTKGNYWDAKLPDGSMLTATKGVRYDALRTAKDVRAAMA